MQKKLTTACERRSRAWLVSEKKQ